MNVRTLSSTAAALAGVSDCNAADFAVPAGQPAELKAARRRVLPQINVERVFTDRPAFLTA
jgi:propanediol dehydratase small subunit